MSAEQPLTAEEVQWIAETVVARLGIALLPQAFRAAAVDPEQGEQPDGEIFDLDALKPPPAVSEAERRAAKSW